MLSEVGSIREAAKQAGVSIQTIYRYRASDPVFAMELEQARQQGIDRALDVAIEWGTSGLPREVVGKDGETYTINDRSEQMLKAVLALHPDIQRARKAEAQARATLQNVDVHLRLGQGTSESMYSGLLQHIDQHVARLPEQKQHPERGEEADDS